MRASPSTARRHGRRSEAIGRRSRRASFSPPSTTCVEGVLTMPTYEIVIDTCTVWDVLLTLCQGHGILADEGRHITFGTEAQDPDRRAPGVRGQHEVVDEYRGNAVGMLEYQRGVPGLDLQKYQTQKVRHYRNRCREMRISPDEGLIEAILDLSVDFVVGAGGMMLACTLSQGPMSGPYRTTAGSDDVALGVPGGRLQRRRDGGGEDELIEKVNAHVAEAHASHELEDVISRTRRRSTTAATSTKTQPADVVRRLVERTVYTPTRRQRRRRDGRAARPCDRDGAAAARRPATARRAALRRPRHLAGDAAQRDRDPARGRARRDAARPRRRHDGERQPRQAPRERRRPDRSRPARPRRLPRRRRGRRGSALRRAGDAGAARLPRLTRRRDGVDRGVRPLERAGQPLPPRRCRRLRLGAARRPGGRDPRGRVPDREARHGPAVEPRARGRRASRDRARDRGRQGQGGTGGDGAPRRVDEARSGSGSRAAAPTTTDGR